MRATLGLGTAATQNTGTSGAAVPLMNGANAWSAQQSCGAALSLQDGGRLPSQNGLHAYFSTNIGYARALENGVGWRALEIDASDINLNAASAARCRSPATPFPWRRERAAEFGQRDQSGLGSFRFGTVFAATGTINTSDAREKTALAPIPESVKRAVTRVLSGVGVFQLLASRAEKDEAARLHVGATAQDVRAAFLAEGEDPERWALFCADMGDDGEERLGVRPDQLFWLALAGLAGALRRP